MTILECVPNVSEGRRPRVVKALGEAARKAGAELLDLSSDPDHHRSVLTLAGSSESLRRAVVALFEQALSSIDLRQHSGIHPRIGTVDVVPFVPLDPTCMGRAVHLAEAVAAEVGACFELPTYLYGEAATTPLRRHLATIRRGGLKGVVRRLQDPAWAPDAGPTKLHPTAGATAVGARFFLVAFNVVLQTRDVAVAKTIAARIREAAGGLPAVRALGLFLHSRDLTQVSMNLVDYRLTSPHQAFAAIEEEAASLGIDIVGSEIVGLVPQAALEGGPLAELRLERFSDHQILENRLRAAGLG